MRAFFVLTPLFVFLGATYASNSRIVVAGVVRVVSGLCGSHAPEFNDPEWNTV